MIAAGGSLIYRTVNQWLVREGRALNFEPYAKGRFAADEADAKQNRPRDLEKLFLGTAGFAAMEQNDRQVTGHNLPKRR